MSSKYNDDNYRNDDRYTFDQDTKVSSGSTADPDQRVTKAPRLLSKIGSASSASSEQFDDARNDDHSSNLREIQNNVYKKPEAIQRNKRIFGALMGHLGVAKRKLEEDSSTIEKRSARQTAVVQKNGMESRRLEQLHKEASHSYKAKEKALREIFKLRQKKASIIESSAVWKDKFISTRIHVLMTQAVPSICWMPTSHNAATTVLLEQRSEEIALEIAEQDQSDLLLTQQIDKELQSLQAYVAAFSNEPKEQKEQKEELGGDEQLQVEKIMDGDDDVIAPIEIISSELSEYMGRIQSKRLIVSEDDKMQNEYDADSVTNRQNWGMDVGYGVGDLREPAGRLMSGSVSGTGTVSYVSSGKRRMDDFNRDRDQGQGSGQERGPGQGQGQGSNMNWNQNQQNERGRFNQVQHQHQQQQQQQDNSSGRIQNNRESGKGMQNGNEMSMNGGEEGEEVGDIGNDSKNDSRGDSRGFHSSGSNNNSNRTLKTTSLTDRKVEKEVEEYNPEEVADGIEVEAEADDEEEDEDDAELLLASLGGRKH